MLDKSLIELTKKLLFFHYKKDIYFPKSCGSMSLVCALLFENSYLKEKYEITYERGHFRNDNSNRDYTDCEYDEFGEEINRYCNINGLECKGCSCTYMNEHSWIEFKNKKLGNISILDFTSIQFNDNLEKLEQILNNSKFNTNELYEFLNKNSNFITEENNSNFQKYIKTNKTIFGKDILNKTKALLKEGAESDITIILDKINYVL